MCSMCACIVFVFSQDFGVAGERTAYHDAWCIAGSAPADNQLSIDRKLASRLAVRPHATPKYILLTRDR
ncbi:hypothetical protein Y032_0017g3315 [Ancylostoma ceylanicum]|nr:hypothetical protein Y032_0017g3315 [Ancylostoma ceylanicum]